MTSQDDVQHLAERARVRCAMPRNADVMAICDGFEYQMVTSQPVIAPPVTSQPVTSQCPVCEAEARGAQGSHAQEARQAPCLNS
jgi:hypothetical protein